MKKQTNKKHNAAGTLTVEEGIVSMSSQIQRGLQRLMNFQIGFTVQICRLQVLHSDGTGVSTHNATELWPT